MIIKPFYTTTKKYHTEKTGAQIIYIHKGNVPNLTIDEYPNVYSRLLPFEEQLRGRREIVQGRKPWYSLWWERDEKFFKSGSKIVFASRTEGQKFTYTEDEFYASRNCFYLKTDEINLAYLSGLLNSSTLQFYMHNKLKKNGDLLQIDKVQFLLIPIYIASSKEQSKISEIVKAIIDSKKANPLANTSAEEKKIDRLVYQLHGLTNAEVKIIDPNETTTGADDELFKA